MTLDPNKAVEKLQRQYKNQNEYIRNNYKRLSITIKKETYEKLEEIYGKGFSVNGLVNELIAANIAEYEEESGTAKKEEKQQVFEVPEFMKD